jgi:hypothetical protein
VDSAAFWIVDGRQYLAEAIVSARSLRRKMPGVRRVLVVAGWLMEKAPPGLFHQVCGTASRGIDEPWYPYSIQCMRWAADNLREPLLTPAPDVLINLDSDAYVVQPFWDLLEVLGRYDLVGTHAPARYTSRTVALVPDAFCELNFGMLAWRNTAKMARLFLEWQRRYFDHQDVYGNNDQAAFRETLWTTGEDIKVWVAPPEYHCRFVFGGFARYPVTVLHGRSDRYTMAEVAARVNLRGGMRTWKRGEL